MNGYENSGYWIFDRNGNKIYRGEAAWMNGKLLPMNYRDSLTFNRLSGPFPIYKWIETDSNR